MIVSTISFFARISDPRFGGTYMTLLSTVSNIGMVWSSSLGLQLLEYLTFKNCSNNQDNDCSTTNLTDVRCRLTFKTTTCVLRVQTMYCQKLELL